MVCNHGVGSSNLPRSTNQFKATVLPPHDWADPFALQNPGRDCGVRAWFIAPEMSSLIARWPLMSRLPKPLKTKRRANVGVKKLCL